MLKRGPFLSLNPTRRSVGHTRLLKGRPTLVATITVRTTGSRHRSSRHHPASHAPPSPHYPARRSVKQFDRRPLERPAAHSIVNILEYVGGRGRTLRVTAAPARKEVVGRAFSPTMRGAPRRSPRLNMSVGLSSLPPDIRTSVLHQLASSDIQAVGALRRCCTVWLATIDDEAFWRSLCEHFFPQPTRVLRAAGKLRNFRAFFAQHATGKLPSVREVHPHQFSDLHWSAEVKVAPYSWKDERTCTTPSAVGTLAFAHTHSFAALPANGRISYDSGTLGTVRLCTAKQFLERSSKSRTSSPRLTIWIRWTVRRADGQATCVYDDMPEADNFMLNRRELVKSLEKGTRVETARFSPEFSNDRWYRDDAHGFAHVLLDGQLTLACEDGWLVVREVALQFMLERPGHPLIEHSASEQSVLDMLSDFDWA